MLSKSDVSLRAMQSLTRFETLGENSDRKLGVVEGCPRTLVESSQLLKNFRMRRILIENTFVGFFGGDELKFEQVSNLGCVKGREGKNAHLSAAHKRGRFGTKYQSR